MEAKPPSSEQSLTLKAKELALQEQETNARLQLEKRGALLTSPLLIAIVSTVFGTGIGAALQGYANLNVERTKSESSFLLERQKFEFSLIQQALEEPNQDEASKQLLFLVNSGVITSLDATKIKNIAEKPEELPTITRPAAIEPGTQGTVTGNEDSLKNIRTDANTAAPAIYEVPVGEQVTITGSRLNGDGYLWYQVYIEAVDREGWIASHLVAVD